MELGLVDLFGKYQGQNIYRYKLQNDLGTCVSILSLGGIVQEFSLKKQGKSTNYVVSFKTISDYYTNPFQVNKQIGRVAGRIREASFMLNNQLIQLKANNGNHLLHGGDKGIGQSYFDLLEQSKKRLVLKTIIREKDDGFPGDISLKVAYELSETNCLTIAYEATALNKTTVFDPTIHIYWNLSDNLAETILQIESEQVLETDSDKIPTGKLLNVSATALDLSKPVAIGQNKLSLDHAYKVSGKLVEPCAKIIDYEKKIKLSIFNDRNGLVVFTANPSDQNAHSSSYYNSLATEPQTLPDALHHREFGDISIQKGQTKTTTMAFELNDLNDEEIRR